MTLATLLSINALHKDKMVWSIKRYFLFRLPLLLEYLQRNKVDLKTKNTGKNTKSDGVWNMMIDKRWNENNDFRFWV